MKIELPVSFSKKYRIISEIGVGGMGAVFRAHHIELDRPAAVKFLTGSIVASEASLKRFEAEGKTCSLLHHPNIVEIYDLDMTCSQPYIVFELVEGHDFKYMTKKKMSIQIKEIIEILAQICDGLHYAHKKRVIHRDVKPSNIIVKPNGQAKIADFGIAKQGDITTVKTRTGVILGTPRYMSPEQSKGEKLTPSTDIYSMGVVLFEAFAGVRPFEAPSELETILKHIHEAPPLASSMNPSLPDRLVELIDQCLAKAPSERPATADELSRELRKCSSGMSASEGKELITLGCNAGLLESCFDEAIARSIPEGVSRKRTSSRVAPKKTKLSLSSAGSDREVIQKACSDVKQPSSSARRALIVSALVFMVFIAIKLWPSSEPGQVADLKVASIGQKGVIVEFRASWQTEKPSLDIHPKGVMSKVDYSIIDMKRVMEKTKEPQYRYSVALIGLARNMAYKIAVVKPDGSSSLPVSFSTKKNSVNSDVTPEVSLEPSGNMALELSANIPFIVKDIVGAEFEETKGSTLLKCYTDVSLSLSHSDVLADKEITVTTLSLDGPQVKHSYRVKELLFRRAKETFDGFFKDYRSGDIYRTFRGKSGRPAEFFRDYGAELTNLKKRNETLPPRWGAKMWRKIDQRLSASYSWYGRAVALAPGLEALCTEAKDLDFTWRLELATIPLRSIQGGAFFQHLPAHPTWGKYVLPSDKGTTRVEKSFVNEPRLVQSFREQGEILHVQYAMLAAGHPQAAGSIISAEAAQALDSHTRFIDLSQVELGKYDEAELEIFLNDACIHRLLLIDLNDGSFVSAVQTDEVDFKDQREAASSENNYVKLGMLIFGGLGTEKLSAERMLEDLSRVAPEMDGKDFSRNKYYQKLPLSALRTGRNTIRVGIINSPTEQLALSFLHKIELRLR